MGLVDICAEHTMKKMGKAAFITGVATQIALPNVAFISRVAGAECADTMYDISTIPYVLIAGAVGSLMYYWGYRIGEEGNGGKRK